jgi:hypothetical protein
MSDFAAPGGTAMPDPDYESAIRSAEHDPQRLEQLYQSARQARAAGRFGEALNNRYREVPDNLLYAAWYYRLNLPAQERPARAGNWNLAIPLSIVLGLVLWSLSDSSLTLPHNIPLLAVLWAPLIAVFLIAFLALTSRKHLAATGIAVVLLAAVTAYALVEVTRGQGTSSETYSTLLLLHLPLLAGCAIGFALLGWGSSALDRFGFLTKAIEVIATAGVASIAGGIFVGLTYGLFEALGVDIDNTLLRLLVVGGGGLIPVLAVAAIYDPAAAPGQQDFLHGFGRLIRILMWALLPLTLAVMIIYVLVIPFNFSQPFNNRDVLIIYNAVLFAVLALLVGVTPVHVEDLPERLQRPLRGGIIGVAALVALVSIYALAAIIYRTSNDGLTMNRLAVIGWNTINILILAALLVTQFVRGGTWVSQLQGVFRWGTVAYLAWGALLVLALPWLF